MKNNNKIDFLVVSANEETSRLVEKALHENSSQNVFVVSSAAVARKVLKGKRVQFVITEFDMPSMNGIELTKLIRRLPALYDLPVLILFDQGQQEHVPYAMEERADHCLIAPFGADELLGAIKKILMDRRAGSAIEQKIKAARILLLYKKYDKAITVAKEVLATGDNDEAYHILSEAYYWQQDYDMATKYLRWLIKSRPDSKTMHLLSKVCRAENQCGDAVGYLMKATAKNPFNLDLKIDLGKLYFDLGIAESADRIFQEVFSSNPSDLHLIKIGKMYLKKGEIDRAAVFLDGTVRPIPETVYIFHQYALALAQQKRYQESAEQFKKCLHIVPKNMTFLLGLGKMLLKMGQKSRAEKVFKHILRQDPKHKEAQKITSFLRHKEGGATYSEPTP